jgi:hypothetical protein
MTCQRCGKREAEHIIQRHIKGGKCCQICWILALHEIAKGKAYGGTKEWRESFKEKER